MRQNIVTIALEAIRPGNNDRTSFDLAALRELALSILEHGLLQPVTVRPLPKGGYQLVAGERRWRAHKLADDLLQTWQHNARPSRRDDGRYTFAIEEQIDGEAVTCIYTVQTLRVRSIPCIVRTDLDDEAAATLMLAENVARENLDPIDEARAYDLRIKTYGWDERACAQRAGVGIARVTNRLKLLKLRPDLQEMVRGGQLSAGYAQIMAEHYLDANRQMIAVSKLREKDNPNPTWFRAVVKALMAEQAQEAMWDMDEFMREPIVEEVIEELNEAPPHPDTTPPPAEGRILAEIVANQAKFWVEAGHAWGERGEPFKRRECEAAATALSALLLSLPRFITVR